MRQFLRDYTLKERTELIKRLNQIKPLKEEQIRLLKEVTERYKLDLKRISMIKQNKLPIKAVLQAD